jgi:hypothetical protein
MTGHEPLDAAGVEELRRAWDSFAAAKEQFGSPQTQEDLAAVQLTHARARIRLEDLLLSLAPSLLASLDQLAAMRERMRKDGK